jgi:C4-dicarboxylate transporter/malic acid transport protein
MLKEINCKCDIIRNFLPSWFASTMGTGVLALVTFSYSKYVPFFNPLSHYIFYFNLILFFTLLIPWSLRWMLFPKHAVSDLQNPVLGNFYPTISVSMLVIAADYLTIFHNIQSAEVFWLIGALSTLVFGIYIPYISFKTENTKLDHINPGWFIPPVGLIVIPIAGSKIASIHSGVYGDLLNVLNFVGWGAGFFLYVALLAIIMYRLILHKPMPGALAPTIWINLGPIGAGTIALLNMAKFSSFLVDKSAIYFSGFLFWGFGIWWLVVAISLTLHYIKKLDLKYEISWWAFTFPLGAYIGASHSVSMISKMEGIDYIGFSLYFLFAFLWITTFIGTIKHSLTGRVFKR